MRRRRRKNGDHIGWAIASVVVAGIGAALLQEGAKNAALPDGGILGPKFDRREQIAGGGFLLAGLLGLIRSLT